MADQTALAGASSCIEWCEDRCKHILHKLPDLRDKMRFAHDEDIKGIFEIRDNLDAVSDRLDKISLKLSPISWIPMGNYEYLPMTFIDARSPWTFWLKHVTDELFYENLLSKLRVKVENEELNLLTVEPDVGSFLLYCDEDSCFRCVVAEVYTTKRIKVFNVDEGCYEIVHWDDHLYHSIDEMHTLSAKVIECCLWPGDAGHPKWSTDVNDFFKSTFRKYNLQVRITNVCDEWTPRKHVVEVIGVKHTTQINLSNLMSNVRAALDDVPDSAREALPFINDSVCNPLGYTTEIFTPDDLKGMSQDKSKPQSVPVKIPDAIKTEVELENSLNEKDINSSSGGGINLNDINTPEIFASIYGNVNLTQQLKPTPWLDQPKFRPPPGFCQTQLARNNQQFVKNPLSTSFMHIQRQQFPPTGQPRVFQQNPGLLPHPLQSPMIHSSSLQHLQMPPQPLIIQQSQPRPQFLNFPFNPPLTPLPHCGQPLYFSAVQNEMTHRQEIAHPSCELSREFKNAEAPNFPMGIQNDSFPLPSSTQLNLKKVPELDKNGVEDEDECERHYKLGFCVDPNCKKKHTKLCVIDSEFDRLSLELDGSSDDDLDDPVLFDGYEATDEKRICKFALYGEKCLKKGCTKEHRSPTEVWTSDVVGVPTEAYNCLTMPNLDEEIEISITELLSPVSFYAILPDKFSDIGDGTDNAETIDTLMESLNKSAKRVRFGQLDSKPAVGQIVLAFSKSIKQWVRARTLEVRDKQALVFCVDSGVQELVKIKTHIRKIDPVYLHLPFQAVRCELYNIKAVEDANLDDGLAYVASLIKGKTIRAIVVSWDVELGEPHLVLQLSCDEGCEILSNILRSEFCSVVDRNDFSAVKQFKTNSSDS